MSFKKTLLFIFALSIGAAILSAPVNATETRVGSMGGIGLYTHDNSNIFIFPGSIYTYAGQVIGEFRVKNNDNSYTIGVNYPYGDYSVIGAYLNRPINIPIPFALADSVALNHTTDFFFGTQMSKFDLGLHLSLGLDSYSQDVGTEEDKQSARYIGLGAGLSHEAMDLGLLVELPSAKRDFVDTSNSFSGFGFGLSGRLFMGQTTRFVPVGLLYMASTKAEFSNATGTVSETDYKTTNIGLGIGLNHELNDKNMIVAGVEIFGMNSNKTEVQNGPENTIAVTTFPGFYMGVESEITRWLIGRLGAAQVYQSTKVKFTPPGGPDVESTSRASNYRIAFGLGFKFADFLLDAAMNEGLFFDGPNFISGGINPMATKLSLTYEF
jgi:hypothetical protein